MIEFETRIAAPIERVFDLARSIDLHVASTSKTDERAVAGVTAGLLVLHDEVTWEARHFGVRQRLTSRITQFERPQHFRDAMVSGTFKRFDHDHDFSQDGDGTVATERFDFDAPLGPLGRIAEVLFLRRYMERFLRERAQIVKDVAESERWRTFLP
jgi:ligand-binding SRPBCC domain-containing protein